MLFLMTTKWYVSVKMEDAYLIDSKLDLSSSQENAQAIVFLPCVSALVSIALHIV